MKFYIFILFFFICFVNSTEAARFRLGSMSRNTASRFSSSFDKFFLDHLDESSLSVVIPPSFKGTARKSPADIEKQIYRIIVKYMERLEKKGFTKFERALAQEMQVAGDAIHIQIKVYAKDSLTDTWGKLARNPMVKGGHTIEIRLANLNASLLNGQPIPRLLTPYDTFIHEASHWMDARKSLWFGNLRNPAVRASLPAEKMAEIGVLRSEMEANLNALGDYQKALEATKIYYEGILGINLVNDDPTSFSWLRIMTGKFLDDLGSL